MYSYIRKQRGYINDSNVDRFFESLVSSNVRREIKIFHTNLIMSEMAKNGNQKFCKVA